MKSAPALGCDSLSRQRSPIGSLGHISTFLWALGIVLLAPQDDGVWMSLGCLVILGFMYPRSVYAISRPRWLFFLFFIFAMNTCASIDRMELTLSTESFLSGAQMIFRALIILMAVNGMAASVNIAEIAGLFERLGMRGIGFSVGVAINLLPNLLQSSSIAWHSFRMRGGLRARWWSGLKLLLLTILTNALHRSEEIVVAAEVRAFRPENCRAMPIMRGELDWLLISLESISLSLIVLIFYIL